MKQAYDNIEMQSTFIDYPDLSQLDKKWDKSGMSGEEVSMMRGNLWIPHELPSSDRLQRISAIYKEGNSFFHGISFSPVIKLLKISKWIAPLILLILFICLNFRTTKIWYYLIPLLGLLLLYIYIGRIAGRVLYGTYLYTFIFLVVSLPAICLQEKRRDGVRLSVCVFLILLMETVVGWFLAAEWNKYLNLETKYDEYQLLTNRDKQFFVTNDVPCLYPRSPFAHKKGVFRNNNISPISWIIYMPSYESKMRALFPNGCWHSLLHDPHVFYLTEKREDKLFPNGNILNYMNYISGTTITPTIIGETERHLIWSFSQKVDVLDKEIVLDTKKDPC
jgi:hypothetical protein